MSQFSDQSRGNYRNYYLRRRAGHTDLAPDRDERLDLLLKDDHAQDLFQGKVVLDVGCNSGAVSQEIAQLHQAKQVIGVDIDVDLIQQCGRTVQQAFSLQEPSKSQAEPPAERSRKKRKLLNGNRAGQAEEPISEGQLHYFPACFPALYGSVPIAGTSQSAISEGHGAAQEAEGGRKRSKGSKNSSEAPTQKFPRNLVFYAANWAEEEIETDANRYDVILALSLTKWIHLHGLDEGLIKFFQKCFDCLEPGGKLVLEKQGWRGYKDAKRSTQTLKDNYFKLKLRPEEDFERILLSDIGFARREAVKDGSSSGFDRSLEIYYKA